MKIFCIMLVKDEADIVKSVITDASKWADRIFVLDNGSSDGTWNIVKTLESDIVCPWKQDFRPYTNGLRADVFNEFRNEASADDWWCFKLDADEFYIEDPRDFLKKIPARYHFVSKKSIDYRLTFEDVEEYSFKGDFEKDREFIKYIDPQCWVEPRFIRYRPKLQWASGTDLHYPVHPGILYPDHILVAHYQHRSPEQMQKRLDLRNNLQKKQDGIVFRHITEHAWKELLKHRSELLLDSGSLSDYKALVEKNSLDPGCFKALIERFCYALHLFP